MDEQIRNLVARYLAHEIQLDDFRQQFAGIYFQVRRNPARERAASRLCDAIIGPYAEFSRGHRLEVSFREELAEAIRPFAESKGSLPAEVLLDGTSVAFVKQLTLLPRGLVEVGNSFFESNWISKPSEGNEPVAIVFPPAHSPAAARVVAPPSHLVLRA